jgi:hypothetical protein
MVSHLPVIDDDGEVGDLSEVDPALFKPFSSLPEDLQTVLRGCGKQKAPTIAIQPRSDRRFPCYWKRLANAHG